MFSVAVGFLLKPQGHDIYISPLLALRLQRVGKHFPLPLLTPYAMCSLCERLKSQNNISTELEADWQSWWSCKQLPLHINSCCEAALWGCCILSSEVLELL